MKFIGLLMGFAALSGIGSMALAGASKPSIKRWAAGDIYPTKAFVLHQEGTTYFRVTVARDGRARDCVVTRSSGSRYLDEATCKAVTTAVQFTPATDENGSPVEALFSSQMNWRIPS